MYVLGYDVGSSSVKAAILDSDTGRAVARGSHPEQELAIESPRPGWAEQDPEIWWDSVKAVTKSLLETSNVAPDAIAAIGISYQMHGLVVVDEKGAVLRPSIIWCDSRAVDVGNRAFQTLGAKSCLERLLNSPGNFTASKLRWMREEEPSRYERIHKFLLPGDYIAFRLSGRMATTVSGLSEGMFWDFAEDGVAEFLLEHYGIRESLVPDVVPTFGEQGRLTEEGARALGLRPGIPLTFRAGDQPNNALSLNVLEPGEIAATAGTSGVVYGVSDAVRADPASRVHSFAHVNHSSEKTRLGVLLCINGTGSANRWLKETLGGTGYRELDLEAARAPVGSEGLLFYPFGNGAERMLSNCDPGAVLKGLRFHTHRVVHVARAVQEGVVFSFRYGISILEELGIRPAVMRAGLANMFLSPLFREALAATTGCAIELYRTDGAEGAARGAAVGAGFYPSLEDAFAGLELEAVVEPDSALAVRYSDAYGRWVQGLPAVLEDARLPAD
jgi:xylulokinase